MISLDEALSLVRARCGPLPAEELPIREAYGRVLAAPLVARRDQPATDVSMMDGYALRAVEAAAPLRVAGAIAAGDAPWLSELPAGAAARIFTGAPLPPGADAVVMQERCERSGDAVRVLDPVKPGQHVRKRGEELTAGAQSLPAGLVLGPAELSLAAACGLSSVFVFRRPRVAILTTGSELVPVGATPGPGKLVETNSLSLDALCREAGAVPVLLGLAGDSVPEIAGKLRSADAEILVTTGGASVGDHDHAQAALESLSGSLLFHTVAIRPGKPVLFGVAGARLVFGLPGNPAAATLGFELFVRLAVRLLQGDPRPDRPVVRARLRGTLPRIKGLTFFPRGVLDTSLVFTPGGQQSSMQIASWSQTNAVARIPPGEGKLEDGAELDVLSLGPLASWSDSRAWPSPARW